MKHVGVHKAKTTLSKLLKRVEAGEEIIISRSGEPVAKLVPLNTTVHRQFGVGRGLYGACHQQRIHQQRRNDRNKIYSMHAPEVECISKSKAHMRYEFGCKTALAVTSKGGWLLAAQARHGSLYDGHTLAGTMEQLARLTGNSPEHVSVDMGYHEHDYEGSALGHVDQRPSERTLKSTWRWLKRRAAIRTHHRTHQTDHGMDCNRLKGKEGDAFNAILAAAGKNFAKIIRPYGNPQVLLPIS